MPFMGLLRLQYKCYANMIDGVAKSPIYCVMAGSRNAQHTICMPPLSRRRHALYIKLFT